MNPVAVEYCVIVVVMVAVAVAVADEVESRPRSPRARRPCVFPTIHGGECHQWVVVVLQILINERWEY